MLRLVGFGALSLRNPSNRRQAPSPWRLRSPSVAALRARIVLVIDEEREDSYLQFARVV